ncbi:MAG: hypothetical protein KBT46_05335 [Ruminococcus sp.]|nr:hypothetical protein [Candidatus Copronaster equi]
MKYIKCELERKFLKMNEHFKAILVTGARHVETVVLMSKKGNERNE